jgi:predicted anti-sigma-YlaC factor YlaD
MNCQAALDLVPEALDETLTESARREFLEHLRVCGACRTYVEQLRLSVRALNSVPKQGKPNPRRAELIEAFRKKFR